MSNYAIFTDSCCDISPEILKQWGVPYANMTFSFDGEETEYISTDISNKEFYDRMRKGSHARTAAINADTFTHVFTPILEEGKDILYVAFSSGLSTTVNNAHMAAQDLKEKYPDRKIVIVDTLAASGGGGLMVYMAVAKKNEGATLEENAAYLESLIASFYERAGLVKLRSGETGSITIGGSVSPAGGNFEEPVTQATLKVVGAFLGLSRERSDARRYPAIHPLDSWSKYPSIVDKDQLSFARGVLHRGSEVNQMMKVIGEEGTAMEDFVVYLKSEFLDYTYLQQNTFDQVDGASSEERQKQMFADVYRVLKTPFTFEDKETARKFFLELRQLFTDRNYMETEAEEYREQSALIENLISKGSRKDA